MNFRDVVPKVPGISKDELKGKAIEYDGAEYLGSLNAVGRVTQELWRAYTRCKSVLFVCPHLLLSYGPSLTFLRLGFCTSLCSSRGRAAKAVSPAVAFASGPVHSCAAEVLWFNKPASACWIYAAIATAV